MSVITIKLDRSTRTFTEGDNVSGVVIVCAGKTGLSHQGITMNVLGQVKLQLSAKSVGIFEAFYSTLKPLDLFKTSFLILKAGTLKPGTHEIPFQFKLAAQEGRELHDTYHGVYINTQYILDVKMKRGLLQTNYDAEMEIFVEIFNDDQKSLEKKHEFKITPDQLHNVHSRLKNKIPTFLFEGHLDSTICDVTQAFGGEIVIRNCSIPIKSIELQLVRVECCPYMDDVAREATEVQNIQIAEGDAVPNLPIAIHMILPRNFTCSTLNTPHFKLDFEVNLHVVFIDNYMITENFPLKFFRSRRKAATGIMSGIW